MSKKSTPPKDGREGRRMRAWELHEQGWKQKDMAAALGVTEGTVSPWFKKARTQDRDSLRHHPPPGAQPKLSLAQRAQLPGLLATGAEAFGFRGQVWTTARVAQMILQQFGMSSHPAHGSRLLRGIKHRLHKPIQKASQRDELAIQTCKEQRWPEVKKRLKRKNARLSLSITRPFPSCPWRYAPLHREAKRPSGASN